MYFAAKDELASGKKTEQATLKVSDPPVFLQQQQDFNFFLDFREYLFKDIRV